MKNIVVIEKENLVVSLDDISVFTEVQYKSVADLVANNKDEFYELGLIVDSKKGDFKSLILDEYQASFLITLMRNNPIVKKFKVDLIKQFKSMREKLITKQNKHNLVTYKDGTKSIRKWLHEYREESGVKINELEFGRFLVAKEVIEKQSKMKQITVLKDIDMGKQTQDSVALNSNILDYINEFVSRRSIRS